MYNSLGDLTFLLHHTHVTIEPKGYIYELAGQTDCFIGVESISDRANHYRLGTIFLRNFYTGLDFDKNLIVIGVNQGTTHATIFGKSVNPYAKETNVAAIVVVVVFMITLFSIAFYCYYKAKKEEEANTVTFAKIDQSEAKKRYKNGVEVKPSELKKNKTAINETQEELLEESLDDADKE